MPELPTVPRRRYLCPRCRATYLSDDPCPQDGNVVIQDRTDQVLGRRYRLRKPIGIGGMGVVWEGEQLTLNRKVAVKIVPDRDDEGTKRFRRGAIVMAKMSHPNIVAMHDLGEHEGINGAELYLVMERLSGSPLDRHMVDGVLSLEQALSATMQTLRALEHVHRRGYIHRDVKPANLFATRVDDDPFVIKLIDFGIARSSDRVITPDRIISSERERVTRVTQPMRILGTPEYMAPEQILGHALDQRVDIYGAGVMLFRLIFGRLPYRGNRRAIYEAHLRDALPGIKGWLDGSKEAIEAWQTFFGCALAKHVSQRFESASAMLEAVAKLPSVQVRPGPR